MAPKTLLYICGINIIAMEWIAPNTIIGSPAEDAKYLPRPEVEDAFWHALSSGEHVVFVAPRRVGKSSIMKALAKVEVEGQLFVYQNVESCGTARELYQRLWQLILEKLSSKKKITERFATWLNAKRIKSVSLEGQFEIEDKESDHKTTLLALVKQLGDEQMKVVLMLDEFPEVVSRVHKGEGPEAAIDLLHTLREMRQTEAFKHFALVLAGSIGLHHVVSKLDRPKLINDLRDIDVPPLTDNEGNDLLELILANASIQLAQDVRDHVLLTVGTLLPYHIQLLVADLDAIARRSDTVEVTTAMVDHAANSVIARNDKFADWEQRLVDYLDPEDCDYCKALLTICAHKGAYRIQEAFNLASRMKTATGYKVLIDDVLERDGYILQHEGSISFRSPFLRRWWAKRHPEHEIPS